MAIFDKIRLTAENLFTQAYDFIVTTYKRSGKTLTNASPYTQILKVLTNLSELIFFYNEASISELNISTAKNLDNIYGLSRLTGHDPVRGFAAVGKIKLKIKPGGELNIEGDRLLIPKYTKVVCLNNNLKYFLYPEADYIELNKKNNIFYEVLLIQGEIETQIFTSIGTSLSSYSVITKNLTDHNRIRVYVNGEYYTKYESLYDMLPTTKGFIAKTGITGGLDIYFGNGEFGIIPPFGAKIEVEYLKTDGLSGNIGSTTNVMFKYEDTGIDGLGNDIDLNETLITNIELQPMFGSNNENSNFTKLIAPKVSKSFVLNTPENYIYFLQRYNYFSTINVFNSLNDEYIADDNIVYLYLIPDITRKLTSDIDYFTVPEEEFTLTEKEKENIIRVINESGQQLISSELYFIDPIIKRYAVNIIVNYYDNITKDEIRSNIRTVLNDYFLSINRSKLIPKADLITLIRKITGIDSVDIYFVSEENESAIINGYYEKKLYTYDETSQRLEYLSTKKITLSSTTEDPRLGLNEFGDILVNKNELPIIKGGWYDRNNKYYDIDYSNRNSLSGLNIFFKDMIKSDLYNNSIQSKFNELINK